MTQTQNLFMSSHASQLCTDHHPTGAVLPLLRTLFDSVLTSKYGRRHDQEKKPPRVVRATLGDGTILVGLDLLREDAELFVSKVMT